MLATVVTFRPERPSFNVDAPLGSWGHGQPHLAVVEVQRGRGRGGGLSGADDTAPLLVTAPGSRFTCVAFAATLAASRLRRRAATPAVRRAVPRPLTEDPFGSIDRAKRYFSLGNKVVQQLGPTSAEDLKRELADDFEFVAPLVGPLPKQALISATAALRFEDALPDFDARYHAFRVDRENARRVWCQMRVTGTHTGELKFAGVSATPRDPPVRVENPPEAVSITFNEAGQVREITTGYPVDRRCGNTGGLGGIFGVLEGAGFPLPVPLTRTCGEIFSPLLELLGQPVPGGAQLVSLPEQQKLPEEQLLQLAEDLLSADLGAANPELLADCFEFTGPGLGPLRKEVFLKVSPFASIREGLPDVDFQFCDLRACPFDTNRVWYTAYPMGTHTGELCLNGQIIAPTGKKWEGCPECGSMQFDGAGRCIAITSGYVIDRRMGNTNGLAGTLGLLEAVGSPSPVAWTSRTPTQLWSALTG